MNNPPEQAVPWVLWGVGLDGVIDAIDSMVVVELYVVQSSEAEARRIKATLGALKTPCIRVLPDWPALEHELLIQEKDQINLYVEGDSISPRELEKLPPHLRLREMRGTFHAADIDPGSLHRISRKLSDHFIWQDVTLGRTVSGYRHDGPEVTVVVPVYGVQDYLDQCLSSLVQQTLQDLEILVVDDGSIDRSGAIADRWAEKDPRVRVIHQENAGCAAARALGLTKARGYFVGFVDGDDWVDIRMFSDLTEVAMRFDCEISQCGFYRYYETLEVDEIEGEAFDFQRLDQDGAGVVKNPIALASRRPSIWRRIYSRHFLEERGIQFDVNLGRFDDLPFQFMTLTTVGRLAVTGTAHYHYRQLRPGQDVLIRDQRLHVHFGLFERLRPFVRQQASLAVDDAFFRSQLASHHWAYSVIDEALRREYVSAASYDLLQGVSGPRLLKAMILAFSMGLRRGAWFLRLLLIRKAKRRLAWIGLTDRGGS